MYTKETCVYAKNKGHGDASDNLQSQIIQKSPVYISKRRAYTQKRQVYTKNEMTLPLSLNHFIDPASFLESQDSFLYTPVSFVYSHVFTRLLHRVYAHLFECIQNIHYTKETCVYKKEMIKQEKSQD